MRLPSEIKASELFTIEHKTVLHVESMLPKITSFYVECNR